MKLICKAYFANNNKVLARLFELSEEEKLANGDGFLVTDMSIPDTANFEEFREVSKYDENTLFFVTTSSLLEAQKTVESNVYWAQLVKTSIKLMDVGSSIDNGADSSTIKNKLKDISKSIIENKDIVFKYTYEYVLRKFE